MARANEGAKTGDYKGAFFDDKTCKQGLVCYEGRSA